MHAYSHSAYSHSAYSHSAYSHSAYSHSATPVHNRSQETHTRVTIITHLSGLEKVVQLLQLVFVADVGVLNLEKRLLEIDAFLNVVVHFLNQHVDAGERAALAVVAAAGPATNAGHGHGPLCELRLEVLNLQGLGVWGVSVGCGVWYEAGLKGCGYQLLHESRLGVLAQLSMWCGCNSLGCGEGVRSAHPDHFKNWRTRDVLERATGQSSTHTDMLLDMDMDNWAKLNPY
eukprot:354263-Chlamydomonas_euryale.AAC.3